MPAAHADLDAWPIKRRSGQRAYVRYRSLDVDASDVVFAAGLAGGPVRPRETCAHCDLVLDDHDLCARGQRQRRRRLRGRSSVRTSARTVHASHGAASRVLAAVQDACNKCTCAAAGTSSASALRLMHERRHRHVCTRDFRASACAVRACSCSSHSQAVRPGHLQL